VLDDAGFKWCSFPRDQEIIEGAVDESGRFGQVERLGHVLGIEPKSLIIFGV